MNKLNISKAYLSSFLPKNKEQCFNYADININAQRFSLIDSLVVRTHTHWRIHTHVPQYLRPPNDAFHSITVVSH